ncbi:MAG TPA: CSLREA domain-containing protein [Chloroflexota bacterium]|nr:CSLREA domain-containing protein [Chloroflexota bacterium]
MYVVNSTADSDDGVCDLANCTLREAINAANASFGADTITFDLGPGVPTIQVGTGGGAVANTVLPPITEAVTIDGNTGGATRVELDGTNGTLSNPSGFARSGLTINTSGVVIRNLVINHFLSSGIDLRAGSSSNIIQGNYLGTDATGTQNRGNGDGGVTLRSSSNNQIGGTTSAARNVISGNGAGALGNVRLITGSTGNRVQGNFIGTNATGTAGIGGTNSSGIDIRNSSDNLIGGTDAGARNIISGNGCSSGCQARSGISIRGTSTGNLIQGNFIGTDVTGTVAVGNVQQGVRLENSEVPPPTPPSNNTVGGTASGAGNVISGNGDNGIRIVQGANNTIIQGNFIGTDATGTMPLGNGQAGIAITNSGNTNTIGGTDPGARNVIASNGSDGIQITGDGSPANVIQGNFIGTDRTGTIDLGNGGTGVSITASSSNVVGGTSTGAGNVVAFNNNQGILVGAQPGVSGSQTQNRIQRNSIFSNTFGSPGSDPTRDAGIDLAYSLTLGSTFGPTPNDAGDGDDGANRMQNFPDLTAAQVAGGNLEVQYSVDSTTTSSGYPLTIEFFKADASANPQGKTFLGTDTYLSTDAQLPRTTNLGDAASLGVSSGDRIVATATDANGNTSEFSLPAITVAVVGSPTETPTGTATATPTPTAVPSATETPTRTETPTPTSSVAPTSTRTATRATSTATRTVVSTPTATPVLNGGTCTQSGHCFVFEYLGYINDTANDKTTIMFRITNMCTQAVHYVAIGTDGFSRIAPADGITYHGILGRYEVSWTGMNGTPGFTSIKFDPKMKNYRDGAADVFSIVVSGVDFGVAVPVAATTSGSSGETQTFLLSQVTCPSTSTTTPASTSSPTPTVTVRPTRTRKSAGDSRAGPALPDLGARSHPIVGAASESGFVAIDDLFGRIGAWFERLYEWTRSLGASAWEPPGDARRSHPPDNATSDPIVAWSSVTDTGPSSVS